MQWYYGGNMSYYGGCTPGPDQPCCEGDEEDTAYGHYHTDQSCGILPDLDCNDPFIIKDTCTGKMDVFVARTQCSCEAEGGCWLPMCCYGSLVGYGKPWIDLTEDMFLFFMAPFQTAELKSMCMRNRGPLF